MENVTVYDAIIESQMQQLSPIYWPYDLINDLTLLARKNGYDGLVSRAETRIKNLRPIYTWSGGEVTINKIIDELGLPSHMFTSRKVQYSQARLIARVWYGSNEEFFKFYAKSLMGDYKIDESVSVLMSVPYEKLSELTRDELVHYIELAT
jgi:hypothetical protein